MTITDGKELKGVLLFSRHVQDHDRLKLQGRSVASNVSARLTIKSFVSLYATDSLTSRYVEATSTYFAGQKGPPTSMLGDATFGTGETRGISS